MNKEVQDSHFQIIFAGATHEEMVKFHMKLCEALEKLISESPDPQHILLNISQRSLTGAIKEDDWKYLSERRLGRGSCMKFEKHPIKENPSP